MKLTTIVLRFFKATADFSKERIKPAFFIRSLLVSVVAFIDKKTLT